MNQLIERLTALVEKQIQPHIINIIRIEGLDNPIVYWKLCENLKQSRIIQVFIAKLAKGKFAEFEEKGNSTWSEALLYLHKGDNSIFSQEITPFYDQKSYVDFGNAITKWRNESSGYSNGQTTLVLLLGTEAVPDTGGLADTSFAITPKELVEDLSSDYSAWFQRILQANSIDSDSLKKAINTVYKAVFSNVTTDIFRFSDFVDVLSDFTFLNGQELIDYIFGSLSETWGIPSIKESAYIPKISALEKGKSNSTKIITDSYKFIERADDAPTKNRVQGIERQFKKYAQENEINIDAPFPIEDPVFDTYTQFQESYIAFLLGRELDKNRAQFLKLSYGALIDVLKTKVSGGGVVEKGPPPVKGEPIEAYASIIIDAIDRARKNEQFVPTEFIFSVEKITLSDCVEDTKESSFRPICSFLGGILDFFNEAGIEYDGKLLQFGYEEFDPFDFSNYEDIQGSIKCTGKWGDPGKIQFVVKVTDGENSKKYHYKWVFSPYSAWNNAFDYLGKVMMDHRDIYNLPTMVICDNIQDYLSCESEEEFYAQLEQLRETVIFEPHRKEIRKYFRDTHELQYFNLLCDKFADFAKKIIDDGLYCALEELRAVVKVYSDLMNVIRQNYSHLNDVQKEKITLLANCFTITSNAKILSDGNMQEVIIPAYHPVILEKMDAKQLFLRDGVSELIIRTLSGEKKDAVLGQLTKFTELATIIQGVDTIPQSNTSYITCKAMWEYYGVYYGAQTHNEILSGNTYGMSIVTDDEDASAMLKDTPMSSIIVRNVLDYIRTFPSRADGLNIAFVAPADMQHIVCAIYRISKLLEDSKIQATINLNLLCINSRKNSGTYLRRWLDSYFNDERNIRVNTFLHNITVNTLEDLDCLQSIMRNHDLCFNYNILSQDGIQFAPSEDGAIDINQAKFPMSFTPDTIAQTSGKARRVNISQFQFLASKAQTQVSHIIGNPDSMPGMYRAFHTLRLLDIQEKTIEISHKLCKWVVCVDPAVDRRMISSNNSKIIGFTTGEGSYGELNVTVSARSDILADIKRLFKRRIAEKFSSWDKNQIQRAADFCIDTMSQYMDGSRVLKALNPYDYEIHSFLAYILTIQMLNLTEPDDNYFIRQLISLDNYRHWFEGEEDNLRPDFMLLEVPKSRENLAGEEPLHIKIKIIECKMGYKSDPQIDKAQHQLEKGLRRMGLNWRPGNTDAMHRYWLNQLYRAIIFSPIMADSASDSYYTIRNKIFGILDDRISVDWTGDVFAFWLDEDYQGQNVWDLDSAVQAEMRAENVFIESLKCHSCGQLFIQKMLLPIEDRNTAFTFSPQKNESDEQEETDEDIFNGSLEGEDIGDKVLASPSEESLPSTTDVFVPFLNYLCGSTERTRQSSLEWFAGYFNISESVKNISYDSNSHPKWETILDTVISLFRAKGLLENTQRSVFHITELGKRLLDYLRDSSSSGDRLFSTLERMMAEQETKEKKSGVDVVDSPEAGDTNDTNSGGIDNPRLSKKSSLKEVRLLLGENLRTHERYYWEFGNPELNNRHLLINGNSGCGKTYCIQTLLMEAALQGVSSVVFDYTGGFANSKLDPVFKQVLGEKIEQRIVKTKKIPVNPFIKHDIQIDDDLFVPEENADVADKIAEIFKSVYSLGDQQRSAVYSAVMTGLKKYGDGMSFSAMAEELENIGTSHAKSVLNKIQTFTDFNPFTPDEDFKWSDIRDSDGKVYVFQLIGYGREIQVLLTELLLWDIWSFCVKNGDESKPFVLVLDEAQNLSHGEKSPSAKILTEGRKFGLSGWYATQFMKPQLSDDEIQRLQQAGQKLYFCPPDDGVITVAKNIDITTAGAKEWSDRLKKLKKGECVTCGSMTRNERWGKYDPRVIKVTSLQERISDAE